VIVDAHTHLGRFNAWPLARGGPEELVAMLEAEGVDCALVSSALALYYDCRAGNAEVLATAARYPRLRPMLCVNPRRPEEARAELASARARGFVGVKLHPTSHEYRLDATEAEVVLACCEREGLPVLTHAAEDDPRCAPPALAAMAARHRDLVLVVGHACLFSSREAVTVAERHPNVYLELSVNYEAGKLEDTLARLGPERLLFGSDAPLHHPRLMLERIRLLGLNREQEEQIVSGNARQIFGL
jgi:uncharacterized protein